MQLVPDEELERLAADCGPESVEAWTLDDLRRQRARDKQVFAFRLGEFFMVGPMPTAQDELTFVLAHEALKCMKTDRS